MSIGIFDPRNEQMIKPRGRLLDGDRAELNELPVSRWNIFGPQDDRCALADSNGSETMVITSAYLGSQSDPVAVEHEIDMNWRTGLRSAEHLTEAEGDIKSRRAVDVAGK